MFPQSLPHARAARAVFQRFQQQRALFFSNTPIHADDEDDDSPQRRKTSNTNFFSLLKVPQVFSLDSNQLKQNYYQLMNEHHPDKHAATTTQHTVDPHDHSSLVTLAYETLKQPHLRAQHLLKLESGHTVEETTNAEKLMGMHDLMEIMEIRETIDSTSDHESLKVLLKENEQRIEATHQALEKAFGKKEYEEALSLTAKLQYWIRIQETIRHQIH